MGEVPVRIEVSGKATVVLSWEDGTSTELTAPQLRAACMCAACREAVGGAATAAVLAGPEPVTVEGAELVGGYALRFTFGPDGHSTGIFPFPMLRSLTER